jgi:hypothetical protein
MHHLGFITPMRWANQSAIACCLLCSCEDPSAITPIDELPFKYNVELDILSSNCRSNRLPISTQTRSGSLTLGTQGMMTIAEINVSEFQWRLEGVRCLNDEGRSSALCLGLRQAITIAKIERAPGVRTEQDGSLSCVKWTSAPEGSPPIDQTELMTPQDTEWLQALQECCLSDEGHPQAIKLNVINNSELEGMISTKHTLDIQLPSNGQPSSLSSDEYKGALTSCGGPLDCVERFQLFADPQR